MWAVAGIAFANAKGEGGYSDGGKRERAQCGSAT